jgi:hypothetical protein
VRNISGVWRLWFSLILRALGLLTFLVGLHFLPQPRGFFGILIGVYVYLAGLINKKKYQQSRRKT